MPKRAIAVVGSTTIDTIVRENLRLQKLGGATTYSGITYRRHGIETRVVTNVAARDAAILEKLKLEHIVVSNGVTLQTTRFVNRISGDRRAQELLSRAAPVDADQISAVADKIDSLHLGPLHPLDIDPGALDSLGKSTLFIVLDVQGYTRQIKGQSILPRVSGHLSKALRIARIVKSSGTELESILDHFRIGLVELMARFKIEEFVVTLGQKGGFVQKAAGEKITYPAARTGSVSDPTGAGDVFFAAYIMRRVLDEIPVPDACRAAAGLSARQVEGAFITGETLRLA